MQTFVRLGFVVLIALCATPSGHGTIPGPDEIRQCPVCRTAFSISTTASGNTFLAAVWSDGKMQAPMFPDRSAVLKCPECGAAFFRLDAQLLRLEYPQHD